jgi:hypothetical protein
MSLAGFACAALGAWAMNREAPIGTLDQYLKQADQPLAFLFRGVTLIGEHKLIPSVARDWKEGTFPLRNLERRLLAEFKRRALPWLSVFRPSSEWEWLMLAQHHGVPTRLLDWTTNPLVALFFACRGDWDSDGGVYVLPNLPELETDVVRDPFRVGVDYCIRPPHISPRVAAQSAYFTVSKDPTKPLAEHPARRIAVRAVTKRGLLRQIARYGINEASLFPDLDGLARDLRQEAESQNLDYAVPPEIRRNATR